MKPPIQNSDTQTQVFKAMGLAGLLFVLGFATTIMVYLSLSKANTQQKQEQLNVIYHNIIHSLQQEIDVNLNALHATKANFIAHQGLTLQEFIDYTSFYTNKLNSLQAIEWVPKVDWAKKDSFEILGKQILPDFQFFEKQNQSSKQPLTIRKEFYPVFYASPLETNAKALGIAPGKINLTRYKAIQNAIKERKTTVSNQINLIQDTTLSNAILVFVPIFNNELKFTADTSIHSFIEGVYKLEKLINSAVQNVEQINMVNLVVLRDENQTYNIIYGESSDEKTNFIKEGELSIADQVWKVEVALKSSVEGTLIDPTWELLIGLVITLLITIGAFNILTDNRKVLRKINEQLQAKNTELEQYAYVASHDLQEPLKSLQGLVTLLKEECNTEVSQDAEIYLNHIDASAKRMSMLISNLLDYSRLGKIEELTQVDCNHVVSTVEVDLNELIKTKRAQIIIHENLPIVKGYPTALKQLFQNLISNAIKFSDENRPPVVEISATKKGNSYIFKVKDNGIGIPEDHLENIFIIFKRLHSREIYEGTGIGLTFCKKNVELHNGKISVTSTLDKGSTFTFDLSLG